MARRITITVPHVLEPHLQAWKTTLAIRTDAGAAVEVLRLAAQSDLVRDAAAAATDAGE